MYVYLPSLTLSSTPNSHTSDNWAFIWLTLESVITSLVSDDWQLESLCLSLWWESSKEAIYKKKASQLTPWKSYLFIQLTGHDCSRVCVTLFWKISCCSLSLWCFHLWMSGSCNNYHSYIISSRICQLC